MGTQQPQPQQQPAQPQPAQPPIMVVTTQPARIPGIEIYYATFRETLHYRLFWRNFFESLGLYVLIRWLRHRLALTNRQAHCTQKGWFERDRTGESLQYDRILNTEVTDDIIASTFGNGTVKLVTGGDVGEVVYENLAGAGLVKRIINDARPDQDLDKWDTRILLKLFRLRNAFSTVLIVFAALWIPFWLLATAWLGFGGMFTAMLITLVTLPLAWLIAP
jgi:hypothetical protein